MYEEENQMIYKPKKINGKPLLMFVGLYVLEIVVSTIAYMFLGNKPFETADTLIWLIGKLVVLLVVLIVYKKVFISLFGETRKAFGKFLLFTLLWFVIFYAFEIGTSYYQMLIDKIYNIGDTSNQEAIFEYFYASPTFKNYFMLFLTIVIIAPLLEEFEFRELIFKGFEGCHFIVPTLVSSLTFGLAHVLSFVLAGEYIQILYLPVYCIPGFCLSLVYYYNGKNLYSSFLVHMTSNLISFIGIMIQINQGVPTTNI